MTEGGASTGEDRRGQGGAWNAPGAAAGVLPPVAPVFQRPTKVVHLIRHGHTGTPAGSSLATRTNGPPPAGGRQFDVPLSTLGRRQAEALGPRLRALKADLILVSPLSRALQTLEGALGADELAAASHVRVTALHTEHVAVSGDVGRPRRQLAAEFPWAALGHLADPWWFSPPGSPNDAAGRQFGGRESMAHLRKRVGAFRQYLRELPEQAVVVIGHSTFFRELTGSASRMAHCEICTVRI